MALGNIALVDELVESGCLRKRRVCAGQLGQGLVGQKESAVAIHDRECGRCPLDHSGELVASE